MSTEGNVLQQPITDEVALSQPDSQLYSEARQALVRSPIRHLAFIMDGNGRWAKDRGLKRTDGHRAGSKTVRMVVEECRKLGIRYLTLFAFSSENWSRPADEVSSLMELFSDYLREELPNMLKNGIRLRTIGDRSKLSESVLGALEQVEQQTFMAAAERDSSLNGDAKGCGELRSAPESHLDKKGEGATQGHTPQPEGSMDLILAISYGSRDEIVSACRSFAQDCVDGRCSPDQISVAGFTNYLYAPDIPDPDLLIRTSDEFRISNFLLWQIAYSELLISPSLWPDFSKEELYRSLIEYSKRNRRFGLTDDQIAGTI